MFLFSDQTPASFKDELPNKVDVVVIGGGIIGITTAWFRLKRGLSVLVCEKGRVAGEQSSRNWGWVRVTGRDPDEVPIAIESAALWREISAELDEDVGFTKQGLMTLVETEQEMSEWEPWLEVARQNNFETRMLSRSDLPDHINTDPTGWHGGIFSPDDCRAEPFKAVPAIARGVQARGGIIRENCAVRSIDKEAGVVSGVVTEFGRVKAQSVVCAAGAWSTLFLSNLGIRFPQLAVRGSVVRTVNAPKVFGGEAKLKDIAIRRRQDGGFTVATGFTVHSIGANSIRFGTNFLAALGNVSDFGLRFGTDATQQSFPARRWTADETSPFEHNRVLNPEPSARALRKIRRNLDRRIPELAGIEFAESWAGMIDATPDVVPVMDQIEVAPGLFLATGFSGHGFGIGPGAGRVMADLIAGNPAKHDLSRFRFSRFSDGSKMRPGPAM